MSGTRLSTGGALPQHDPAPRRLPLLAAGAWVALFAVNGIGILPWLHVRFPVVDLAEMMLQVRRIQLGFVPYRDTFTHHFLGYTLPLLAASALAPLTSTTVKVVGLLCNFVNAICIYLILKRIGGASSAWLGAFLAVTLGWFSNWQGVRFNIQSLLVPVLAGMLLGIVGASTRREHGPLYAAAALGGLLLISDQRAAVFLPLLAVPLMVQPSLRQPRLIAIAIACFAIAPLASAAYLMGAGAWNDFVQQTIVFPLFYRNRGIGTPVAERAIQELRFWFWSDPPVIFLTAAALAAMLYRERRVWLKVLVSASFACGAAYAASGGRAYSNYFLLLSPAVLLLISLLPGYLDSMWARRASFIVVISVAVLAASRIVAGIQPRRVASLREGTVDSVAAYLRTHTRTDDPVLVWGFAPQTYLLSGRLHTFKDPGLLSVAGANFESISSDQQGRLPGMVRAFDWYLANTPPKVIVVYSVVPGSPRFCSGTGVVQNNMDFRRVRDLWRLRDLLDTSYRRDLTVEGPCDRADVYLHSITGSTPSHDRPAVASRPAKPQETASVTTTTSARR